MHRGNYVEALADFETVIDKAAADGADTLQEAHRGRGWCLVRLARPAEALAAFEAALCHVTPDRATEREDAFNGAQTARAALDAQARRPATRPKQEFRRRDATLGRTPAEVRSSLFASLGWAHLDRHNRTDAARAFTESLRLHADNPDARCGQARLGFRRDPASSLEVVERTLTAARVAQNRLLTGRALRARGWIHVERREFDGAIDDFSAALAELDQSDAAARESTLTGRAYAHYRLGRRADAQADAAARHGRISIARGRLLMDMFRIRRRLGSETRQD